MGIFRRRRNHWQEHVVEEEIGLHNSNLAGVAGDIIYKETFPKKAGEDSAEFAADVDFNNGEKIEVLQSEQEGEFGTVEKSISSTFSEDAEFSSDGGFGGGPATAASASSDAGVTENAPYHNMAKYKMVAPDDDDSTISTHSS